MDAITLLKNDHKTVEDLFRRFEQAGDRAYAEKRRLVDRMIEELSRHAAIEEQLFYPATRMTVPETEDIALESIEEHHIVKWELEELKDMDPRDERFDAKVSVLIENVRHHVEEEESDYFPKVRDELGRNDLNELGDRMQEIRKVAPTRPHPRLPQTPPFNVVAGLAAGAADMVGDTVRGVAQGSVSIIRNVVGLVPGVGGGDSPAPFGSSRTRAQAAQVIDLADDAAEVATTAGRGAQRTARTAAKSVSATARTASSGAKGAATSARKGASNTRSSAKRAATSTGRTARKGASSTRRAAGSASRSTKAAASS